MTLAEKITKAYERVDQKKPGTNRPALPGALVFVWKEKPKTGKAREGIWSPFGLGPDGLPKIKIATKRLSAHMAVRGFFPAARPTAKPAEVKEASTTTRTRKKKESDGDEI